MTCRATWNGETLAESESCIKTEGNLYFPPESIRAEYLRPSTRRYTCPWKGRAGYYDIIANGEGNKDAAWYYYDAKPAAAALQDYVAFDTRLGVAVEGEAVRRIEPPRPKSVASPEESPRA